MDTKIKIGSAGKRGSKVRSDCYIEIELTNNGGIKSTLTSKVDSLYGQRINDLILEMCDFFEIAHAKVLVEDYGALEFTLAARFEAAYKKINPADKREFLPTQIKKSSPVSTKDRMRRSRLYLPGNEPKFYPNAGLHNPDGIILDLEDSVPPSEKHNARYLVRNALRNVDFYNSEKMVRINQLPMGLEDLSFVIPHNVDVVLIPKCESAAAVKQVDDTIQKIKTERKIDRQIFLMPILESALGVINAFAIASASKNICALTIGLEDYTADLGIERTNDGAESIFARSMLVNAAKAAGIQAIDSVFSDIEDLEGLAKSVREAKALGFEGKGCIHPRQIEIVHKSLAPTDNEIEKAKKIILAFKDAEKNGIGVVTIGSKMIDAPIVKRAQHTIQLAILNNLLSKDWDKIPVI